MLARRQQLPQDHPLPDGGGIVITTWSRYLKVIGWRTTEDVDSLRAARSAITYSARKRPLSLLLRTCPIDML